MGFLNIKIGVISAVILGVTSGAFAKSSAAEKDTNYAIGNCVVYTEGKPIPWGRWGNQAGAECKAFDDDLSTSTGEAKTWAKIGLMVDFGEARTINEVSVHYTAAGTPNPNLGYSITGSDDGVSFTVIKTIHSSEQADSQTNVNANFRYIMIQFPMSGFDPWWGPSISEIGLWGKTEGVATAINLNKPRAFNSRSVSTGAIHFSNLMGRSINTSSTHGKATGYYLPR